MGGITDAKGALEFIIAGAFAVAVGTASFSDPMTSLKVIDGIAEYLEKHGIDSIRALVGTIEV